MSQTHSTILKTYIYTILHIFSRICMFGMNICFYIYIISSSQTIILPITITYFITLQHDFEIERNIQKSIWLHSREEKRKANWAKKPDCNLTCIFIDPTYMRINLWDSIVFLSFFLALVVKLQSMIVCNCKGTQKIKFFAKPIITKT